MFEHFLCSWRNFLADFMVEVRKFFQEWSDCNVEFVLIIYTGLYLFFMLQLACSSALLNQGNQLLYIYIIDFINKKQFSFDISILRMYSRVPAHTVSKL